MLRKISLFLLVYFSTTLVCYADADYDAYQERMARNHAVIDTEIAHAREMKKLELQYEIYTKELALQKDNINIDNSNRTDSFSNSKSNSVAESTATNVAVYPTKRNLDIKK